MFQIVNCSIYHKTVPVLNQVLTGNIFLVFLCSINVQLSNLVCSHNDTLACSPYMVLIIFSVPGIGNIVCLICVASYRHDDISIAIMDE